MTSHIQSPRRRRLILAGATAATLGTFSMRPAFAATKIRVLTNWLAEPEHGGFYQAMASGLYAKEGLDVEIGMGGPQVNGMQLLTAGKADVLMSNGVRVLNAVEQGLPVVAIAASYQADLQCVITHPDVTSLSGLKGKKIFVSASGRTTYWPWMKAKYDLTEEQVSPFTGSVQPFLADKNSALGGLISSEPYAAEKGGVKPNIFLLYKEGFPPYGAPLTVMRPYLDANKPALKAFVRATMQGWKDYMIDPKLGNEAISKANPDQSQGQIDYAVRVMRDLDLIGGGDARKLGVGIMTAERWKETAQFMVDSGLLKPTTDWKSAYTSEFVDGLGITL
jgi:NitT/TauT family transport system substrate-binding protein